LARGNACNLSELSGAFGDLGTLVPFVLGYIVINGIDDIERDSKYIIVLLVTAGVAIVNVGVAFAAGLALHYLLRARWLSAWTQAGS
jgi:hypothetical protein